MGTDHPIRLTRTVKGAGCAAKPPPPPALSQSHLRPGAGKLHQGAGRPGWFSTSTMNSDRRGAFHHLSGLFTSFSQNLKETHYD